jgi:hypothetical protein
MIIILNWILGKEDVNRSELSLRWFNFHLQ